MKTELLNITLTKTANYKLLAAKEYSRYKLKDHLGNVRVVVNDRKDLDTETNTLTAHVEAYNNYYPYGMLQPNRHGNSGNYRYAYQGQEKDPETGMEAFQLRLWDARIGRWLTTDPYGQHFSPYLGMSNNPVSRIDPDGGRDTDPPADIVLDEVVITGNGGGGLQPRGMTWMSETGMMDFAGSMSQWQGLTGNVFSTNHSLAYDQWDVSYGDAFRNYNIPTSINSDGFAALYSSGWKAWDKNGLGNDLMNFAAGGISLPLVAASPLSLPMMKKAIINMSIDASMQYGFTGTIDVANTVFAGATSPAISPLLGSLVDVNAYGVNVFMIYGNKGIKEVATETFFGYAGYGLKSFGGAIGDVSTPYFRYCFWETVLYWLSKLD